MKKTVDAILFEHIAEEHDRCKTERDAYRDALQKIIAAYEGATLSDDGLIKTIRTITHDVLAAHG